ncbi:beta-ketoacyl synthase N-terminal-like domain-containing protein [Amycolatopsis aidingensis]|uniref:beta-ketoacyl synthase N-terminal-like domain-containing protein n=1 Tax=Amycolatopsis aidingensis TaxID=2842453 RepID=UPI001C0D0F35|nr:beta-ketoacyl synthase N-terminal-like domain-containing protein [Amycolatopsis aidingensis]
MNEVLVVGVGVASARLKEPEDTLGEPVADIAFDPVTELGRGFRYKDRATRLAMLAATRALADAALADPDPRSGELAVSGADVGVVASSNLGNLDTVCRTAETILHRSVRATSPMALPNASSNIVASSLAVRFGIRGPNLMVCNGASSGLDAIHLGTLLITAGRAHQVLVVGAEPANEVVATLTGASVLELFDGAAALVLEAGAEAATRDAAGCARLRGYARRPDAAGSVTTVLGGDVPPGLWLVDGGASAPAAIRDVPRRDLTAVFGDASGALGVLQAVAGVQWLSGGADAVLATAGVATDGVSSLLLERAGGAV